MEIQPNPNEKASSKPKKNSPLPSPIKRAQTTSSTPVTSTSKVLIITPEQIAKLGLTQQINKVVQSQVHANLPGSPSKSGTDESPRKKNVRVSKLTIINPKPSEDDCINRDELKSKQTKAPDALGKSEVATGMKNKLSTLLNARSASQISASASSSSNIQNVKHKISSESLGTKRKREIVDTSLTKLTKTADDDVIFVDTPAEEKITKEHLTKLIKEEPTHQNVSVIVKNENSDVHKVKSESLNDEDGNKSQITIPAKANEIKIRRSKIKMVPNISSVKNTSLESNSSSLLMKGNKSIQAQQPKEEAREDKPQPCEDVKHKILVLSNEPISLPQTYIASLKSRPPEKSCISDSAPIFIYKSPTSDNSNIDVKPLINLIKEEIDKETEIHSINQQNDSKPSASIDNALVKPNLCNIDNFSKSTPCRYEKQPIANIKNLETLFVDKDSILMINDSQLCDVISDSKNEITTNSNNSSCTDANYFEHLPKTKSSDKSISPIIDLTESAEVDELEKNVTEKEEPRTGSTQNFPIMKSAVILNFAAKIKNKIDITSNIEKDQKMNISKKIYGRNSDLHNSVAQKHVLQDGVKSLTTEKVHKQDLSFEPKCDISSHSGKIEVSNNAGTSSIQKTYTRKINLPVNLSPKQQLQDNVKSATTEEVNKQNISREPKCDVSLPEKIEASNNTGVSIQKTYNRKINVAANMAAKPHLQDNGKSSTTDDVDNGNMSAEFECEKSYPGTIEVSNNTGTSIPKTCTRKINMPANLSQKQHLQDNVKSPTMEVEDKGNMSTELKCEVSHKGKNDVSNNAGASIKKTYTRKVNLVANPEPKQQDNISSITEKVKNRDINPEPKSEIPQQGKIEIPVITSVKEGVANRDINTEPASSSITKSIKKTYTGKLNLTANAVSNQPLGDSLESSTKAEVENKDINPEPKPEIPHLEKIENNVGASVRKTYTRKINLTANLARTESSGKEEKKQGVNYISKSKMPHPIKMEVSINTAVSPHKTYSRKNKMSADFAINEKSKSGATNSKLEPEMPHSLNIEAPVDKTIILVQESCTRKSNLSTSHEKNVDSEEKPKNQDLIQKSKLESPPSLKLKDSINTQVSTISSIGTNNAIHQNEAANSSTQETNETVKPTPKKRGRKKKSEMIKAEVIEVPINFPEPEIETSRRGRKRKVVNYFALAEGQEFDEMDSTAAVKKPRRNTSSFSESINEKDGIVEIDTIISCSSKDNTINCTYSAQEISPLLKETPKRKRGRPPRVKVVESVQEKVDQVTGNIQAGAASTNEVILVSTEKVREMSPTNVEKINEFPLENLNKTDETDSAEKTDGTSSNDAGKINEENTNQSSSHETPKNKEPTGKNQPGTTKRKRGRPWGKESYATNMINAIFQQINTPTQLDTDEPPNETNAENTALAEGSKIESVFIKMEVDDHTSIAKQPHEEPCTGTTKTKKKKRGRKPKYHLNFEHQPSITASDGPSVTCAVCNAELAKSAWGNHKLRFHNNLAWKVGDPPLDLNDQKLVMNILSDIYKRRKPLYCEKCGESKKSVLGYLSHKSMCQRSSLELSALRVKCEFCDRTVLPVSMTAHLKFCKGSSSLNSIYYEENADSVNHEDSTLHGKRKAATKAHNLIKSLKEDDGVETISRKRNTHRWYLNFDFRPTYFGSQHFRTEIAKNGIVMCRFEDCQFKTTDEAEISNHLSICDKKPTEGYTCKFCITTFKTEADILEHIQTAHKRASKLDETATYEANSEGENLDEEFDYYNEEDKTFNKNKAIPAKPNLMHGIRFLLKHRYCVPSTRIAYPPAFDWTLKFCKENFAIRNLFPNWRTTLENWEKLQPALIAKYLPHLKYSARTTFTQDNKFVDPLTRNHEWKCYKLFESNLFSNGTTMIFCGGPILAMSWAPTPHDRKNCDQILAVSASCDADKGYTLDRKYSESGLIQFWNCGPLANETFITEPPRLEFCIAHDYGPIWHLEWCPSGCFDVEPNEEPNSVLRLGVLAIGSADSSIYLYSVCSPGQISAKILKPKPILKLVLDAVVEHPANGLEAHVTKISWSKASGHQYLAAGYANGMVAIYCLHTTATLLKLGANQHGVEMIMPYRVFTAHHHAITVLSLYHLNDGRRWILTGSVDRDIKYWDLENPDIPLTNFTKYIVTDGVWLNHWLSSVHCFDDSCAGGLTYSLAHQLRNFESDSATVMHSNSRVMSITGSEWINGFVQGNVAGELQGFFPHQMFFAMDGDKSYRNKKVILGYTRLVEIGLDIEERIEEEDQKPEVINIKQNQTESEGSITTTSDVSKAEPITYKGAEEKYGLVFADMTVRSAKEFTDNISNYYASNKSEKLFGTKPNVYPMQSITKVTFNPNQESFLYLASGYQAGFVKISCLQFFKRRRD